MTLSIEINNEEFLLHPSGVIFWLRKKMLLIADVHLGKVAHFRKYGSAVPKNASQENFEKLNEVISFFNPKTICFLGDLFHSKQNSDWEIFVKWTKHSKEEIILISGNHDVIPKYLFEELGIIVKNVWEIDGFLLTHHPTNTSHLFNFAGHIHPGIRMQGIGRQHIRLACFFKMENQLILPAFGNFTGKHILNPKNTDEIYAIVEGEIVQVSKK
jgi:DNA ligase-associated metallophosphoesterase